MKTCKFDNGDEMPMLGLGTWNSPKGEVFNAVIEAIKIGYRHFDCALRYENEPEVGEALSHAIYKGLVKREELWLTTKLWNNAHLSENVRSALRESLNALRLEYLDLYLIHWPVAFKPEVGFPKDGSDFLSPEEAPLEDTWNAMIQCRNDGLIRHAGVSNFSIKKLQHLLDSTEWKPEINQVEAHPFLQQNALLRYCQNAGIHMTAYAPLGSGGRADWLKRKNEPSLLEHPIVHEIAKRHACTPAQVLIAWAMDRGTAVIPKSTNPGRLKQNFESIHIHLDKDDRMNISGLDKHFRYIPGTIWTIEGSPYSLENLWDE